MGAEFHIEFETAGFAEILESGSVYSLCESKANEVAVRANANLTEESDGFQVKMVQAHRFGNVKDSRWIGQVYAADYAAVVAESEHKALSGALK